MSSDEETLPTRDPRCPQPLDLPRPVVSPPTGLEGTIRSLGVRMNAVESQVAWLVKREMEREARKKLRKAVREPPAKKDPSPFRSTGGEPRPGSSKDT